MISDEQLADIGARLALQKQMGNDVPESLVALVQAVAATRDEQRRHELARKSAGIADGLGQVLTVVGMHFLEATLLGLGA